MPQLTAIFHPLRAEEVAELEETEEEDVEEGETKGDLLKEEDSSEDRLLTVGLGKYDQCDTYNLKDLSCRPKQTCH